jgi:hypothetical protein
MLLLPLLLPLPPPLQELWGFRTTWRSQQVKHICHVTCYMTCDLLFSQMCISPLPATVSCVARREAAPPHEPALLKTQNPFSFMHPFTPSPPLVIVTTSFPLRYVDVNDHLASASHDSKKKSYKLNELHAKAIAPVQVSCALTHTLFQIVCLIFDLCLTAFFLARVDVLLMIRF